MVKKVWHTDGQTDRRTDRRTENTICRAAWSQLKIDQVMAILRLDLLFKLVASSTTPWVCNTYSLYNKTSPHISLKYIVCVTPVLHSQIVRTDIVTNIDRQANTNKHTGWKHYHLAIAGDNQRLIKNFICYRVSIIECTNFKDGIRFWTLIELTRAS